MVRSLASHHHHMIISHGANPEEHERKPIAAVAKEDLLHYQHGHVLGAQHLGK